VLVQRARSGANQKRLPRLSPGRYLLAVVATDAAGNRSATASTRFRRHGRR
jgi:hypothetical protein